MSADKLKPVKKEVGLDDDDDDDVPLALTRAKKPLKKEIKPDPARDDVEDDDDRPISLSSLKKKSANGNISKVKSEGGGNVKPVKKEKIELNSNIKPSKVKKEEKGYEEDEKPKKKKIKEEIIKKKIGKTGRACAMVNGKREKKSYSLPGQKHDPPEERDSLRIFYESLYQQVPTSEMAAIWMMEWGLLPAKEAAIVYEKKLKKSQQQKFRSPVKVVSIQKTVKVSAKVLNEVKKEPSAKTKLKMTKKRKADDNSSDEDDDDDFIMPQKKVRKLNLSD